MWKRTNVLTVALVSALCTATLVGCTALVPEAVETPATVTTADGPSTEPVPSGTPSPEASQECRLPRGDSTILSDELLDVGLYAALADFGPRAEAEGTVTYAEDGSLASYLVAPGDSKAAIRDRLCVGHYSFEALNAVRRGSLHSMEPTNQAYLTPLYAGDTLNLSPYTIASVGDVNGEVHSYETVFILPPQR
ncbi:hypothetical protein [Microbacterium sp. MEJ108Y]|uniref:hypothetical protein n=1 Tax=Microbacterium sp. MEJ108Y TaxID=1587523 RepID=UPI0012E0001D|nr:hypothetical protein [Microbacterium sp. MEJ108Y]